MGLEVTSGLVQLQEIPAGSGNTVSVNNDDILVDSTASSARYKTNVEPLDTDPDAVLDLEPRQFDYQTSNSTGIGYIAEEVDDTLPELVTYDDKDRPEGVKYDRLGLFLQTAIRHHRSRIENLEADHEDRTDALAAEVESLRSENERLRSENERLQSEIDHLNDRLASIEDRIADIEGSGETPVSADD